MTFIYVLCTLRMQVTRDLYATLHTPGTETGSSVNDPQSDGRTHWLLTDDDVHGDEDGLVGTTGPPGHKAFRTVHELLRQMQDAHAAAM